MMEMQMKMKLTKKDLCCFNPNPKPGSVVRIKFGWRPIWRLDRDRSFFNATASSHLTLLAHNSYNPLTTVFVTFRFFKVLQPVVEVVCQSALSMDSRWMATDTPPYKFPSLPPLPDCQTIAKSGWHTPPIVRWVIVKALLTTCPLVSGVWVGCVNICGAEIRELFASQQQWNNLPLPLLATRPT